MARAPAKPPSPPPTALTAAARFVILHGKERFLQDQYLRTLREDLSRKHGAEGFDTVRFDGQQGARILADIMDECRSFGLMQQHKIVLIDNAEMLVKADDDDAPPPPPKAVGKKQPRTASHSPREVLEAYTERPSDGATLVLRAATWRPGNLDKAVAAMPAGSGSVIKCEPPSFDDAANWATRRCKARHNSTIDLDAARALVHAAGVDLGRIDTELEKLALAAGGDGSPITLDLVERMVGKTRQEEFFAIQGSLLSGDAARVLGHLRELIEVSRQDPVPIAWAYIEAARKLHLASRAAAEGRDVGRLQYQLKVFGPGADQMMANLAKLSRQVSPVLAATMLRRAVQMDAGNKSGLGEPVRNLEVMALAFAGAGR
ncbi:MAG: DNA polymerase III subunit delta [Phycisphaerales bacterium]|nr:DNA polymerase III subunit delta [Phycisphaerales bacterium]